MSVRVSSLANGYKSDSLSRGHHWEPKENRSFSRLDDTNFPNNFVKENKTFLKQLNVKTESHLEVVTWISCIPGLVNGKDKDLRNATPSLQLHKHVNLFIQSK